MGLATLVASELLSWAPIYRLVVVRLNEPPEYTRDFQHAGCLLRFFFFDRDTLERVSTKNQHNMWTRMPPSRAPRLPNHLRGGRGGSIRTQASWAFKEGNSHIWRHCTPT